MSYARQHLQEAAAIIQALDADAIERIASALAECEPGEVVSSFSESAAAQGTARMR